MNEPTPELESLAGTVERITFHSEETGFCVLRVNVNGQRELLTVVGSTATISAGEYIDCKGNWINDRRFGLQFKAQYLEVVPPITSEGVEKYLASNMVKGIGPHFAKKLVAAFGTQVFDVIENTPHRLTELKGIGEKRRQQVTTAWASQKMVRNIMIFLHAHGVGTARAIRIYKTYGDNAVAIVKENPYRLAQDIHGIGFKTADVLAERLGIARDAPIRAQAGVCHVLQTLCDYGHCAAEHQNLVDSSHKLLAIPTPQIEDAITHQINEKRLIADSITDVPCLFPAALYQAESKIADYLLHLKQGPPPWQDIDAKKAIDWVSRKTMLQLSPSQYQALITLFQHKVSIITGGPGVGKTTIINNLVKILQARHLKVTLCAPTGRAAKRISETTQRTAKTIHRLLNFQPGSYTALYNQDNPLVTDVLIVDESSMIDIKLFYQLLKAVPRHAALILVGDIDQLPSVGPGLLLADLIKSRVITTVRLTEIFRQATQSKIILNAHRINAGQLPLSNEGEDCDFYTLYCETPEEIHAKLLELVTKRLPEHYQCNPITDIQVLSPMNRGGLGSQGLNLDLQSQLNGDASPKLTRYGRTFAPGDKIIQLVNNYDKKVFNGDIGFIEHINLEEKILKIRFEQRILDYDTDELDEINLAYTISIHKSQGSEFPIIIIPIATQHYALLARNLLYTAVTRGKKLVILITQKKAISIAIKNNRHTNRLTKLAARMQCVDTS